MAILSPRELEIMNILWQHGPLKPAEIQEKLQGVVANTQKTLKKFMVLREIAVDKLNELTSIEPGGNECG